MRTVPAVLVYLCFLGTLTLAPERAAAGNVHVCIQENIKYFLENQTLALSFSNEDFTIIQGIFADSTLSMTERSKRAFEYYLGKRLQTVSPEIREEIEEIVKNRTHIQTNTSRVYGEYLERANRVIIGVPHDLRDSVIDYYARVHEIEHAIASRHRTLGVREPFFWAVGRMRAMNRFIEETATMQAEYRFLNLIPDEEIDRILKIVDEHPDLARSDKRMIRRNLLNSRKSPQEYLDGERTSGRYSLNSILRREYAALGATGAILFFGGFRGGLFLFKKVCEEWQKQGKLDSLSGELRSACRRVLAF